MNRDMQPSFQGKKLEVEAQSIANELQTEQSHIIELDSRTDNIEHGLNESYEKAKQMLKEAALLKEKLQKQFYSNNTENFKKSMH